MSKLRDLIYGVDRSEANTDWSDMEVFAKALGMNEYYNCDFSQRVKKHWLSKWMCTDTWVGMAAFYMDGEPVAVSRQTARKSDEEIEFISKEAAEKIRKYIVELTADPDDTKLADLDAEVGDHYTVHWTRALLVKKGMYNGVEVTLTHPSAHAMELSKTVKVTTPDGAVVEIGIEDFKIPYHIAGEPYSPTQHVLVSMTYYKGSEGGSYRHYGFNNVPVGKTMSDVMGDLMPWLRAHHINPEEREEGYDFGYGNAAVCDAAAFEAALATGTLNLSNADLTDLTLEEEPEKE
jgi:hypothetical protein